MRPVEHRLYSTPDYIESSPRRGNANSGSGTAITDSRRFDRKQNSAERHVARLMRSTCGSGVVVRLTAVLVAIHRISIKTTRKAYQNHQALEGVINEGQNEPTREL